MKTKILFLSLLLMLAIGCNKDDDNNNDSSSTSEEIASAAKIDNISDDVLQIVESESDESQAGKIAETTESFLSDCVTITTQQSGNAIVRTLDFGTTNCALFNGNLVRGKIILTFNNDFDAATRTISYAFDNFYHNDRHVEGNRTVVKTILSNGHPQATIDLNLTVTTPNGGVYLRTGQRVREFTEGYNTPNILIDNVFSITGSWTTTLPTGNVQVATITSAVIAKWNCMHIVSGTINFTRNGNVAVLDYGNGTCDDDATITINGTIHQVHL